MTTVFPGIGTGLLSGVYVCLQRAECDGGLWIRGAQLHLCSGTVGRGARQDSFSLRLARVYVRDGLW